MCFVLIGVFQCLKASLSLLFFLRSKNFCQKSDFIEKRKTFAKFWIFALKNTQIWKETSQICILRSWNWPKTPDIMFVPLGEAKSQFSTLSLPLKAGFSIRATGRSQKARPKLSKSGRGGGSWAPIFVRTKPILSHKCCLSRIFFFRDKLWQCGEEGGNAQNCWWKYEQLSLCFFA